MRGKLSQLSRDVAGLKDRLRYPAYNEGVPSCYVGERIFLPEQAKLDVEIDRINSFAVNGPLDGTTLPMQYVVRDSMIHDVPVTIPGPGVFVARYMHVEFYQRLKGTQTIDNDGGAGFVEDGALEIDGNDYTGKELWVQVPWGKTSVQGEANAGITQNGTTGKIHCMSYNNWTLGWAGDRNATGINLFWNLIDRDSERRFGDDLLPDKALLPQGYQNEVDGDLFEFDVPWLFERAGRLDFQFRLINPIMQLAPEALPYDPLNNGPPGTQPGTVAIEGNGDGGIVSWDDREDSGASRNQAVKVRVELHGTKHYSERDTLLRESV
jgi:hypothetical protein